MNSFVSRHLFFSPVRMLRGEPIAKALKFVRSFEFLDNQRSLLFRQVQLAYEKIPYYRRVWGDLGLSSSNMHMESDFFQIPILEKSSIQNNPDEFLNPEIRKFEHRSTSGSTGTPLKFVRGRQSTAFMDAAMYHSYGWHGIDIGDRQVRFWGEPQDEKGRKVARLKDYLMNRIRLSAFRISDEYLSFFADKIERFRPTYIYGYPSLICQFAEFIKRERHALQGVEFKGIICTGEQLLSQQRLLMEDVFQAKTINEYGCTEVGVIAFECSHGAMHELSPTVKIEVVNAEGESVYDEEGDLVVTELHAQTFPFIRYRLGDRGILSSKKCSCGLAYPLLDVVTGRIDSYIKTPDGRLVYDAILAYTLKRGVRQFKAVQEEVTRLTIYVVYDELLTDNLLAKYETILMQSISNDMVFNFVKVRTLPRESSGKLRYFESRI